MSGALADLLEVAGPGAFWRIDNIERHRLTLLQAVEVDGRELRAMKENFVAVIGAHETKTTIGDDFLDPASRHSYPSGTKRWQRITHPPECDNALCLVPAGGTGEARWGPEHNTRMSRYSTEHTRVVVDAALPHDA